MPRKKAEEIDVASIAQPNIEETNAAEEGASELKNENETGEINNEQSPSDALENDIENEETKPKARRSARRKTAPATENQPALSAQPPPVRAHRGTQTPILTIEADGEAETQESREDIVWHEIRNAYHTKKILTGTLGGVEKLDNGKNIAVVYYKDFRVIIPISEMIVSLVDDELHRYGEMAQRQSKILGNMLGAEIDFIVKGIDTKARSIVASRKDAMFKKRQTFYMGSSKVSKINEGRIVQARVIAVAQKVIRVEVFGVECSILARDLSWEWIGDAHELYSVGDQILVRILEVNIESLENITISADVRSVTADTSEENLKKCRVQGKYAGRVTDVYKGAVYIRLSIGVNAIAHSCYDSRMPGKKDDVSFAVTHIDNEKNVAVGIITRIIKQNI